MKRSVMEFDISLLIAKYCGIGPDITVARSILKELLALGMRPPSVSEEDAQAIMSVYCGGNFYQWDEDLALDTEVQEAKARRAAAAIERSTPEGRAARRARLKARRSK